MRKRGDTISPTRAAKILGVHKTTIYIWCKKSVIGINSKIKHVEIDQTTGRFIIKKQNIGF